MTDDVDYLYDSSAENLERLKSALEELEATYFDPAGRHFVPDHEKLSRLQINLLRTRFGKLDLLQSIGSGSTFADLKGRSKIVDIESLPVRVLDLEAIIESKELAGRPKDLYALLFLRELQDMTQGNDLE